MKWRLHIPRHPDITLGPGSHQPWYKIRAAKQEDTELAMMLARSILRDTMPWSRVAVVIQIISPVDRRRDVDNFLGRCKGLLDGRTRAGVWIDDNSEGIESIRVEFIKQAGERPATVFLVEDLDEG